MLNGTPAAGSRRKRSLIPRQQQVQSTNATPRSGRPIRVGVDFAYGSNNLPPVAIMAATNKLQTYPNYDIDEYLISSPETINDNNNNNVINTSDTSSSGDEDDDDDDYNDNSYSPSFSPHITTRRRHTKVSENTTSPLLPDSDEDEYQQEEYTSKISPVQKQSLSRKRFIRDIRFWILCCWAFARKVCCLCWNSRRFRTVATLLLLGLLAASTIPLVPLKRPPNFPDDWKSTASDLIAKYIPNLPTMTSSSQHKLPLPPPPPQSLEEVVERLMAVEAKISSTESQIMSALDRQLEENNHKQEALLRELVPGKLPAYLDSSTNRMSIDSEFSRSLKKIFVTHEESEKAWNQILEKTQHQLEAYVDHKTKQQVLKLVRDEVGGKPNSNPVLIETLVKSAIERFSGAGNSPDYALITAGARIIPAYTTPTYQIGRRDSFSSQSWSWPWRRRWWWPETSNPRPQSTLPPLPGIALHPDLTPGMCWPFSGSKGQLGVRLAESIIITSVTVEHIGQNAALDISTAPKTIRVYGEMGNSKDTYQDQNLAQETIPTSFTCLAEIEYDINGPWPIQTFQIRQEFGPASRVIFSILDNWGNEAYTCLYKVRVHGRRPGTTEPQQLPNAQEQQQRQQIQQDNDQAILGDDDPI